MRTLALAIGIASVFLTAQSAVAQQVRACPPGQAVQSLDPGGKVSTCIPVPAPVDLGPVNARIDEEAVARMQADQDIRDSLTESSLSGRYAVVGTGNCLRSSGGFRSDLEFVPAVQTGSFVQPQSFSYTGIRTIDGSVMHGSSMVYSLTYPSTFFNSPGFFQSGGGTVVAIQQDHSFTVDADGTLTLTSQGSHGTFTKGGGLVGATVDTVGMPPLTGRISKDGRTIALTNADMAVEQITTTQTNGTATTISRVCHRTETMYKLAD
jgi:hypothetical protein